MMLQSSHWFLFKKATLLKCAVAFFQPVNAQIIKSVAKKRKKNYTQIIKSVAKKKKPRGLSIRGIVRKIDISLLELRRIRLARAALSDDFLS